MSVPTITNPDASAATGRSTIDVPTPPGAVRKVIPVSVVLDPGEALFLDLANPDHLNFGQHLYESVKLVEYKLVVKVSAGTHNTGFACVKADRVIPGFTDEWARAPISQEFPGSAMESQSREFVMPPNFAFGREYRALSIGNPHAIFHFAYNGEENTEMIIRGHFTVSLAGDGVGDCITLDHLVRTGAPKIRKKNRVNPPAKNDPDRHTLEEPETPVFIPNLVKKL